MAKAIEVSRLFVTLEAETKGLDADLAKAERSLGRTADFIQKNPVAAMGAMSAALTTVAVAATSMAADVDSALRRLTTKVPGAQAAFESLKDVAADLSVQFGLAQTEVVGVMEQIARTGVSSADDLTASTRAVVEAQKASGAAFESIVKALDTSLDGFGLSAQDSESILAKLLATAKGATNIEDLTEVLAKVGPAAKASGVSFDLATAAIAGIQTTVTNTKEQVKVFKAVLEKEGAAGLETFAKAAGPVGDALKDMQAAAAANNGTLAGLNAQLKQQFNATLIELGTQILPLAIQGMQALSGLIEAFTGKIKTSSAVATVTSLSGSLNKLNSEASKSDAFDRMREAMGSLVPPAVAIGKHFQNIAAADFSRLTDSTLKALKDGLDAAAKSGLATGREASAIASALGGINAEITKRGVKPIVPAPDPKTTKGVNDLLTSTLGLGKAGDDAAESAKRQKDEEKKLAEGREALTRITNALKSEDEALIGNARKGIEKLREEMLQAGGTVQGVDGLLRPLLEKLKALEDRKPAAPLIDAEKAAKDLSTEIENAIAPSDDLDAALRAVDQNVGAIGTHLADIPFSATAEQVGDIAQSALNAAEQFGVLSGDARDALGYVVTLAEELSHLKFKADGGLDIGSLVAGLPGIIGSLSGFVGSIISTGAESRRILRENTEAVRKLTETEGDLVDAKSSGKTISKLAGFTDASFKTAGLDVNTKGIYSKKTVLTPEEVVTLLKGSGLTLSQIDQAAKDLGGITIKDKDGNYLRAGLNKLFEASRTSDTADRQDFTSKRQNIRDQISAGILTKPQEFGALLGATGGGNAITDILGGLDTSSPTFRAEATSRLQSLFADLSSGKVTKDQLGNLSRSEFKDLLLQLLGILLGGEDIAGGFSIPTNGQTGGGTGGTVPDVPNDGGLSGPAVPPPIELALSDGFGSLADLSTEGNSYLSGILDALTRFVPLAAPNLQPLAALAGAAGLTVGTVGPIQVTIQQLPGQSAQDLTDFVMDAIERELAIRLDRAIAASGSVVRA